MPETAGRRATRLVATTALLALIAACGRDVDFRQLGPDLRSREPVRTETEPRPEPDARGVISYPGYQMAVARGGDTVTDVADRVGIPPRELARFNGLEPGYRLRPGEILALPSRVAAGTPGTAGTGRGLDIESIATEAIDRAGDGRREPDRRTAETRDGIEPVRHQVERGETAYSIARLYNVSVRALADWNGLGPDLEVREGQYLLIPLAVEEERQAPSRQAAAAPSRPGEGSPAPEPPSASSPLPEEVESAELPASPALAEQDSAPADDSRFLRPVGGEVIRGYAPGEGSDGVDFAAAPGTAVKAADDGEVALISRSVGQSTIVLIRHGENLYTVYSNVVDVSVEKGETVRRGQPVASVADASPSFLHFEVRRGTEAIDPMPFLN